MSGKKQKTPGLGRAIWRERLTSRANLAAIGLLLLVLGLIAIMLIRVPDSVTFTQARIDTATMAQTDFGSRPVYTATGLNGQSYAKVKGAPRSQTVLSPGDTVCLRVQTDRFTGRVTAQHAPENPDCTSDANTLK